MEGLHGGTVVRGEVVGSREGFAEAGGGDAEEIGDDE